jgi:hypothetical protein
MVRLARLRLSYGRLFVQSRIIYAYTLRHPTTRAFTYFVTHFRYIRISVKTELNPNWMQERHQWLKKSIAAPATLIYLANMIGLGLLYGITHFIYGMFHALFYLACGFIRLAGVFEVLVICQITNCLFNASLEFVAFSTHLIYPR